MSEANQQPSDFKDDAQGWAQRWKVELSTARKELEKSRQQGDKVVRVYLDERDAVDEGSTKWNFFWSDIQQKRAMLNGNLPKADVSRRFGDADDDVARVAGEISQRCVNADLEKRSDTAREAFDNALFDWLVPGLATVRVRYDAEFEATEPVVDPKTGKEIAPAGERVVPGKEVAAIDYVYWKDVLYAVSRTWAEVPWVGFAADMPQGPFVKRFGEDFWKLVPKQSRHEKDEEKAADPWARVRVWELWHKEEKRVFWYVEGFDRVLDIRDDPLRLDGFFPCPNLLVANASTGKLVPKPDYVLAQDLYAEINSVSTRIETLQRAIKAAGVYDGSSPELKRLLDDACQNQLLPSEHWGAFVEKGGINGAFQVLPIDVFAGALTVLRDYRRELVDALYQVTGQADIMRGQATQGGATAHEQKIKASFGSVRMQHMQDRWARFVSEAQALKLEVICKHFQPESIRQLSNADFAFRADEEAKPGIINAAIQLMKSQYHCYRVEVKTETVSLTDFAQLKSERTEVVGMLATYLQQAAPLAQAMPGSLPFLLKLLQAGIAGLRGSSTMEGVLDAAIEAVEKQEAAKAANPQQPPPDPKLQAEQLKLQGTQLKLSADMQKEQLKHQNKLAELQAETHARAEQERVQSEMNVAEHMKKQAISNALKPPEPPPGARPLPRGGGR